MNLYFSKIYVLLLLIVCRLASGLGPLFISKKLKKYVLNNASKKRVEKGVSYSMDFSGGILLATAFIHMIPEVREHLVSSLQDRYIFPFAETLVCIGLFTVYVIEEMVKSFLLDKTNHSSKTDVLISVPEADVNAKMKNGVDVGQNDNTNLKMTPINISCPGELNLMVKEDTNECNNNMKQLHGKNLKHLLLVSALSFHSVMEGLAIGLATSIQDLWYLFVAVMLHECAILLCVGIELVANSSSTSTVIKYMAVLALVSPAGVSIGTVITLFADETGTSSPENVSIYLLQGLAAGTILYVTFFEVLNNHKHHHSHPQADRTHHDHHSESGLPKLAFIALGFAFMIILELTSVHEVHRNHEHGTNCVNHTSL